MRVWLAPSAYFPNRGGVEELTFQIAREMSGRGHAVTVVAPRHPADLPEHEVLDGVTVSRVAFTAPRLAPASLARFPFEFVTQLIVLWRLSRRDRPDLVHIQCPSVQMLVLVVMCGLRRVPLVVTSQGEVLMDANQIYQNSTFMRAVLRLASRRASALTACSSWTVEAAASIAPGFAAAEVILNGIDPDQWSVAAAVAEPVVCAWGRHVTQKGFDLLIASFAAVREAHPTARLRLGGSGTETARLQALAGPGVEFVGALDRIGVQELLASSRVAVVPSRLEPFGIVATEAMATGRPVVWSTIGGLGDATGGLGWGVDPNDSAALGAAVIAALESDLDPRVFRAAAERLSWAKICDQYERVWQRVT